MIRFLHAADFHLDSAFSALSPRQASARRRESRELLGCLAAYVNERKIDLVLLAGDLMDSRRPFRETVETLAETLGRMEAEVFIAPGNHDPYVPGSLWQTVEWPENVHVFTENRLRAVELPRLNAVVHGAAFVGAEQGSGLLRGFCAPEDGWVHIGLLHGEVEPAEERYDPLRREEIAASGLAYLALGHIHKRSAPVRYGKTLCAWPGCLEGHGFDETGEKGFYQGVISGAGVEVEFVPFARRKYEILEVDVTGQPPLAAVEAALPANTADHFYRILLTGETGEEGLSLDGLREALEQRFYGLELRDHTRMAEDVWARCGEDSLRGLFLRELKEKWDAAPDEAARQQVARAARFGLAALDHREIG